MQPIIPVSEAATTENRIFLIAREPRGSDPFPLRHFDSTSTFAKKRGFPHPPPLFPSRSTRCSLSLLVVTPPPRHKLSLPSFALLHCLPLAPSTSPLVSFPPLYSSNLLRSSSLSRESRRLFLPRGCFIKRQKNIAAESRWRWGPDAVSP